MKLELPKPTRANLEKWFVLFEKRMNFSFGLAPSTLAKNYMEKAMRRRRSLHSLFSSIYFEWTKC